MFTQIGGKWLVTCLIFWGLAIATFPVEAKDITAEETPVTAGANQFKGSLFLIGGAADDTLQDFVDLAGGEKANIAIITHASSDPAATGDEIANDFKSRGVKNTTILLPGSKSGLPKDANAVYICGGDQNRLMRLLDDPLPKQLRDFLKEGGLIGGSSAGAAVVPQTMISGGMTDGVIRAKSLRTTEGLALFEGVIVDTHVNTRARDVRLMTSLCLLDDVLAIGLDEDTAIHVGAKTTKVYGKGHVRLYKPASGKRAQMTTNKAGTSASITNVSVTVLTAGDEFDTPR